MDRFAGDKCRANGQSGVLGSERVAMAVFRLGLDFRRVTIVGSCKV